MAANLLEAYFADEARAFFALNVRDRRDRQRAIERSNRPPSAAVLGSLRAQNERLGESRARAEQLEKLGDGARVVVTGQQVGLFLGPLFTLYKAATAIKLARLLQDESGVPVVPVFWLQTEDHDLPEIATASVPRAGEAPLLINPEIERGNRRSIAHVTLPEDITHCTELLARELEHTLHAPEHVARVLRHYTRGGTWGQAFAGLLAELFEPEGLLLLDPRDPVLARETAWVHQTALERADELEHGLITQSRALHAAGFAETVHVRSGSPLSFYHPQGAHGPRTRLVKDGEAFLDPRSHQRHTLAELSAALERDPLCFSSSALLRPIIQDSLLPTAAYVGGPAELAYFAQLPPLYRAFELELNIIAPRARFRLIEPKTGRLLSRLGLSAASLARSEKQLLQALAPSSPGDLPSAAHFEHALQKGFAQVIEHALAALPDDMTHELTRPVEKTRARVLVSAGKLATRYGSALLQRDQQTVSDIRQLKQLLFPNDAPQERCYGFSYYAARFGERRLIERILAATDPQATDITELVL